MKQLYLLLFTLLFGLSTPNILANPVLPLNDNAIAPNFTVTDINGVSHTLYDYLDQGKMVILDFSATWCPPCWAYHQAHILADIYNAYGPNGTNEVMVLFIEADASTPLSALYGTGNTQGDWVTGTPYPIINDASLNGDYAISYFPTLYAVCSDRKIYEAGQTSISGWLNRLESCSLDGSALIDDVTCHNGSDGSIDLTGSGGYGNVSYSWSTGSNSEDISNLSAGSYAVTLVDDFNRQVVLEMDVDEALPISPVVVQNIDVTCNGQSDGTATVIATGGNGGFSYVWSNGQTGNTLSNVSAGTYDFTITDSEGCTESSSLSISEPLALASSPTILPENCGNSDGLLVVNMSGGTLPYLYDFGSGQTSIPTINGLSAGDYSVTVTDLWGCELIETYTVPEIPAPTADAGPTQELTCTASVITLDGSGSSNGAQYIYTWTTSDGNIVSGANTLNPEVDAAGTYTLEVFDGSNACVSLSDVVVSENLTIPAADAGSDASYDCSTSSIILDGSNSDSGPDFTYQWLTDDGEILGASDGIEVEVGSPGTYLLEVTHIGSGCVSSDEVVVVDNSVNPTVEVDPIGALDCNTELMSLDASASSGAGELSYSWTTSDGQIIGATDGSSIDLSLPGTYTVAITDNSNDCVSSLDYIVEGALPVELSVSSIQDVSCHDSSDGSAEVSGSGGDGNFTYEWSDGQTGAIAADLLPGSYTVIVTDGNGCTAEQTVEVTAPEALTLVGISTDETSANANDGTVQVSVNGGTGNYTFEWSNGSTEQQQIGLAPGNYVVVVTDENGCTSTVDVDVNAFGCAVTASIEGQDISCFGLNDGTAQVVFTGAEIEEIVWSNGAETNEVTGLSAGVYTVSVVDINNCPAEAQIEIIEPAAISVSGISTDLSCFDSNDGLIDAMGSGGTGVLTPVWNNGMSSWLLTDMEAGMYELTVTDENGCSATSTYTITAPDPIIIIESTTDVLCFGDDTGAISIDVSGGTGELSYVWSDGSTGNMLTNLSAGTYIVEVLDENNCIEFADINISEPAELGLDILSVTDSNDDVPTGAADISISGGVAPYTFTWTDENGIVVSNEEDLVDVFAGTYMVEVEDANGCTILSEEVEILTIVSVVETPYGVQFAVSPNPFKDQLILQVTGWTNSSEAEIKVIDLQGRIVYQLILEAHSSLNQIIDTESLESGMYFMEINMGGESFATKLVKS